MRFLSADKSSVVLVLPQLLELSASSNFSRFFAIGEVGSRWEVGVDCDAFAFTTDEPDATAAVAADGGVE